MDSRAKAPVKLKPFRRDSLGVCFDEKYVVPEGANAILKIKQKIFSLSGNDFQIVDIVSAKILFKIGGQVLTSEEKQTIFDGDDKPVFCLKEKVMQLDNKQSVYTCIPDGDKAFKAGEELFKVGSNFENTTQYTEGLKNKAGKEVKLNGSMGLISMKGGLWLGEVGKGKPVAKICSPVEFKNFLPNGFGVDDFLIEIPPGVDMALVVAVALAYQKMN